MPRTWARWWESELGVKRSKLPIGWTGVARGFAGAGSSTLTPAIPGNIMWAPVICRWRLNDGPALPRILTMASTRPSYVTPGSFTAVAAIRPSPSASFKTALPSCSETERTTPSISIHCPSSAPASRRVRFTRGASVGNWDSATKRVVAWLTIGAKSPGPLTPVTSTNWPGTSGTAGVAASATKMHPVASQTKNAACQGSSLVPPPIRWGS